ncbi:MAG: PepSY-like domain-containing protein [Saprospiraceae bacterium]|nr:PepSY-like domain-containing protein [Saprospiraceae bacterium]
MKNLILFVLLALGLSACDKEEIVPAGKYCTDIETFVQTHFPQQSILQVIRERDDLRTQYIVSLTDGVLLEFNRNCDIMEIQAPFALPASVIPPKVWDFAEANYPSNYIVAWELDGPHQEVELDNGIGLIFTKDGEFLKIDY